MTDVQQQLPPADYQRLIAILLDSMGCKWSRNDTLVSTCLMVGPCEAHEDRGEACKGARGVSYHVESGPLSGPWKGWGTNADQFVFDRMVSQLDAAWRAHFKTCEGVARALRSVGR